MLGFLVAVEFAPLAIVSEKLTAEAPMIGKICEILGWDQTEKALRIDSMTVAVFSVSYDGLFVLNDDVEEILFSNDNNNGD